MDNSTARTLAAAILILLVAASGLAFLSAVRHSDRKTDAVPISEEHVSQEPLSELAVELVEITNGITSAFHKNDKTQSYVIPYASGALEYVNKTTNDMLRLVVARHLAREVLRLNLIDESYHFRWQHICDAADSICYADSCLWVSGAPEMERCKFIFDALMRVKEAFLITLEEPPTKPTDLDRYGRGESWAQYNCKDLVRRYFASIPDYLNNSIFRRMYPTLSPETQEYFRKRFREVFGIDYHPDKPGETAYISAAKDTRWDGRGLKWRICDKSNNWHDVEEQ